MKHTPLFALVLMVASCSENKGNTSGEVFPLPAIEGRPQTMLLIKNSWSKLIAHCPGLVKYKNDMSFDHISDLLGPVMGEMARADIVFKISDSPKKIPPRMRAFGHTCRYGISPDGATLRIQKNACVSVCLGRLYDGPTDYLVTL